MTTPIDGLRPASPALDDNNYDPYAAILDTRQALRKLDWDHRITDPDLQDTVRRAGTLLDTYMVNLFSSQDKDLSEAARALRAAQYSSASPHVAAALAPLADALTTAYDAVLRTHQKELAELIALASRQFGEATRAAALAPADTAGLRRDLAALRASLTALPDGPLHEYFASASRYAARAAQSALPLSLKISNSLSALSETLTSASLSARQLDGTPAVTLVVLQTQPTPQERARLASSTEAHDYARRVVALVTTALAETGTRLDVARTNLERSGATGGAYENASTAIAVAASALEGAAVHARRATTELEQAQQTPSRLSAAPAVALDQPVPRVAAPHVIEDAITTLKNTPGFERVGSALGKAVEQLSHASQALGQSATHSHSHGPSHSQTSSPAPASPRPQVHLSTDIAM